MTAREVVEKAKKSGTVDGVADEMLYVAVERLELMIQKLARIQFKEFEKDVPLYAAGGEITNGFDKMYDAYVKSEGCYIREDWQCLGNYETIFQQEWEKFKKEHLKNRKPEGGSFTPDWGWS